MTMFATVNNFFCSFRKMLHNVSPFYIDSLLENNSSMKENFHFIQSKWVFDEFWNWNSFEWIIHIRSVLGRLSNVIVIQRLLFVEIQKQNTSFNSLLIIMNNSFINLVYQLAAVCEAPFVQARTLYDYLSVFIPSILPKKVHFSFGNLTTHSNYSNRK